MLFYEENDYLETDNTMYKCQKRLLNIFTKTFCMLVLHGHSFFLDTLFLNIQVNL